MKRQHGFFVGLLLAIVAVLALAKPAEAAPQRLPGGQVLVGAYWSNLDKVRAWVTERGVNTLVYCKGKISGRGRADWEDLHKLVEQLRAEGHVVWVIRPASYQLETNPGEQPFDDDFDARWRHHLLALGLPDEIEDKIRLGGRKLHLSVKGDAPRIRDAALALVAELRARRPGYDLFVNFNGEHLANVSEADADCIGAIARACDRVACDNWRGTVREVMMPGGVPRYGFDQRFRSVANLRKLVAGAGVAVHGYFDTANQKILKGDEWFDAKQGLRFEPSRAPTVEEMRRMAAEWAELGWVYFAIQPNHGVNDATSDETAALLAELAEGVNPRRTEADVLRERLAGVERERDEARADAKRARKTLEDFRADLEALLAKE